MARPTGIVTFLFTDIEDSTPRWESDPDGMRRALAVHDDVLRAAIEAKGGWHCPSVWGSRPATPSNAATRCRSLSVAGEEQVQLLTRITQDAYGAVDELGCARVRDLAGGRVELEDRRPQCRDAFVAYDLPWGALARFGTRPHLGLAGVGELVDSLAL